MTPILPRDREDATDPVDHGASIPYLLDRSGRLRAGACRVHLDLTLAFAGLIVGFVIGLTGVGGGALLTPVLVIFFGISAPAAVSSDIIASLVLKPIGGAVHWRRGTV